MLSPIFCYPRPKELTADEEESDPSPSMKCKAPSAEEDTGPAHEEAMAEEPATPVRHRIHGTGGRMRGIGGRIISCHPAPALRAQLETVPESAATIQLPERK
jgi:hypothetical protein